MPGPPHEGPTLFDPDRLTKSYGRALTVADYEVRRLRHTMIEPEHLLIGLLGSNGTAAVVLYETGLSLASICRLVEERMGWGEGDWYLPRMVRQGEPQPPRPRFVGYSTETKDLLESSFREVNDLQHRVVTTAHLLSAVVRDGRNGAAHLLRQNHVNLEKAREESLQGSGEED